MKKNNRIVVSVNQNGNARVNINFMRTGGEHRTVLTLLNACWQEADQIYLALAFNRSVKGAATINQSINQILFV